MRLLYSKVYKQKFIAFSGVSLKTQELMALFLAARLICSIIIGVNIHTLLNLTSLVSELLVIWMIRFRLKSSYLKELDTLPLSFVVSILTRKLLFLSGRVFGVTLNLFVL
ncbi:putative ER lumen protein retaining receptor [Lupinus albus]|uniref:Putative ER lumen protein retaining receptor n=1 Tax=Lupinus albus TaxID=3870 RepID=A0A6A4PPJ0_LUPAL|nr:putative ER lumen protein retaining receptor [Lupinus albus]